MRIITSFLALFLALPTMAQENPEFGFLNMIHAIPEGGNCQILINGIKVNEAGFKPGDFTGGLMLKTGSHKIEIDFKDKEPATGEIRIETGKTSAYAIFNHVALNPKTKEPENTIRITRLQPASRDGYHLEAVSLSEGISRIRIAERTIELNYLKSVTIDGWNGSPFAVNHGAEKLGSLAVEEKGTYVILVGRNAENKEGAFFFRHFDFELPEWFRPKKEKPTDTNP